MPLPDDLQKKLLEKQEVFEKLEKLNQETEYRSVFDGIADNETTVMRAPEDWPPPPEDDTD